MVRIPPCFMDMVVLISAWGLHFQHLLSFCWKKVACTLCPICEVVESMEKIGIVRVCWKTNKTSSMILSQLQNTLLMKGTLLLRNWPYRDAQMEVCSSVLV